MKPSAAGKGEDRLADRRAMLTHQRGAGVKFLGIEDNHRPAIRGAAAQVSPVESALEAGTVKGNVILTEPLKALAKYRAEKITTCLRIGGGEFDIVDLVMLRRENFVHGGHPQGCVQAPSTSHHLRWRIGRPVR